MACVGAAAGSCGWSFPGPELAPCGLPFNGEGQGVPPPAGVSCPGQSAECAGMVPLDECKRLCTAQATCNAISWGRDLHDCYLKNNAGACDHVASDTMCPWATGTHYEHHIRCPCGFATGHCKLLRLCKRYLLRAPRDEAAAAAGKDGRPKIDGCPAAWGSSVILATAVLVVVYGGVGAAYSFKTSGKLGHPHRANWAAVGGLVTDGVVFTRRRLTGAQSCLADKQSGGGGSDHGPERGSAPSEVASHKSSRSTKSKSKSGKKKSGRASEADKDGTGGSEPLTAATTAQPASGVAAASGGRWVRVPA